ncbi:hypothetical protein ALON55S_08376 [Alishewanella longhuensis]
MLAASEQASEPYRAALNQLRQQLIYTRDWLTEALKHDRLQRPADLLWHNQQCTGNRCYSVINRYLPMVCNRLPAAV